MRGEREQHGLEVRICLSRANAASIEIGAGLRVLDDLAEHVELLELAARRLGNAEREDAPAIATGMPSRKYAHRQPSSPPAMRGDAADEDRAEHADEAGRAMAIDALMRPRMPIG